MSNRGRQERRERVETQIETLTQYMTQRLVRENVLVSIRQLLCRMAGEGIRHGGIAVVTPGGQLRITAEERSEVSPLSDLRHYDLQVSLPGGVGASRDAPLRASGFYVLKSFSGSSQISPAAPRRPCWHTSSAL